MFGASHLQVVREATTAKATLATLVLVAGVVMAACGSGAASPIPTPEESPSATPILPFDGLVIDFVADGFMFSKTELQVPAGAPFRILLDNQDNSTAHGVAIGIGNTPAAAREAALVFKGAILPGPGIQAYDVQALAPGTYWFFCQPHASMNGTITVE
jgi:plastocyanin